MPQRAQLTLGTLAVLASVGVALADLSETSAPPANHAAIAYDSTPSHDPVAELNRRLQAGTAHLKYEDRAGFLRSVLDALNIPVESQIAVYSKTSLQLERISPSNPRTLFFNDSVVAGWMGGGMIELAAHDPRQGVHFYTLEQRPVTRPGFEPGVDCLRCHIAEAGLGVPGMLIRSMYTAPNGSTRLVYGGFFTDHRSPLEERFGGWYVTGDTGAARHLGNVMMTSDDSPEGIATAKPIHLDSLPTQFKNTGYLSPYSDIAALLVFNHQMHMINLITRLGWESRVAPASARPATLLSREPPSATVFDDAVKDFVDYLLFVDEAPLHGPMHGTSGFAEAFAARGPFDKQGRSLRRLALDQRLMRYPCSYMIYSDAFEALPAQAKAAVYKRMWQVLSGADNGGKYARLSLADRRAVVEILRDTKSGLPDYFTAAVR